MRTLLNHYRKALIDVRANSVPFTAAWGIANRALQRRPTGPKPDQTTEVTLDVDRAEVLYYELQGALIKHHSGHNADETPSLVYEAVDALALALAGILANLHKISPDAATSLLQYFHGRLKAYIENLQKRRQKKPDEQTKLQ